MSMSKIYEVTGRVAAGGAASVTALASQIQFDGSAGMGDQVPGPAHLLASALAACVLKNVERFGHMMPFAYTAAHIEVTLERQDSPPRIIAARYALVVETDEPPGRASLLHRNIRKFGTISNTLALSCPLHGALTLVRTDGSQIIVEPPEEPNGPL
jgi:uncharacterized OsmC-like protein